MHYSLEVPSYTMYVECESACARFITLQRLVNSLPDKHISISCHRYSISFFTYLWQTPVNQISKLEVELVSTKAFSEDEDELAPHITFSQELDTKLV